MLVNLVIIDRGSQGISSSFFEMIYPKILNTAFSQLIAVCDITPFYWKSKHFRGKFVSSLSKNVLKIIWTITTSIWSYCCCPFMFALKKSTVLWHKIRNMKSTRQSYTRSLCIVYCLKLAKINFRPITTVWLNNKTIKINICFVRHPNISNNIFALIHTG